MESPPLAVYISPQSKKRVFPGSSSSCMDPDVVEISPPIAWGSKSKSIKQKEIIQPEVIDIDMDEESGDIMLIDEKVNTYDKGKEALATFSYGHGNPAETGSVDGFQSSRKSSAPGPNNSFNLEGFGNEFLYGDDECTDIYHDDLTYDDEYAFLQAHFDTIDIPPGVEAPIPWFSGPSKNINNAPTIYSSNHSSLAGQMDVSGTHTSHSWGLPELEQSGTKLASLSRSSSRTRPDTQHHPQLVRSPSSWSFPKSFQNKKPSAASTSSNSLNSPVEIPLANHPTLFKSSSALGFPLKNKKPAVSGSTTNYTSHIQLDTMQQLSSAMDSSFKGYYLRSRHKKPVGNDNLTYPKFSAMDTSYLPGVGAYMSGWQGSAVFMDKPSFMGEGIEFHSPSDVFEKESFVPWVRDPANTEKSATAAGSSAVPSGSSPSSEKKGSVDDMLKNFQLFKQFDIVQDHSDHHYSCKGSSLKQPSKTWAKKIQDEWRILEKDLPDTIFVRVYESRMDLLRAVIVGAEGTPYHDGLFFFDFFFPCGYPNVPPHVYYHSGGLRINPNLYNCGKVCLSLLNTWSGSQNEKWIPGMSTMLQVLVSIQALILNEKPYFNEPGYARMSGSPSGEKSSQQYNENTFILSLKTMGYTMRKPPKYFEDFVGGHFCKHAHDILVACKAYMDGAQVGCLAKGGVQDVDAGDKSCSQHFKDTLASNITVLVQAFTQIGAKDCEKFLPLAQKGNGLSSPPMAATYY